MKIKFNKNSGPVLNCQRRGGFTLIELMVASSIFAIIMITAIGALLMTFGSAKNSRALRIAMDNVSFAVESMTRSIRMGTSYYCLSSGESYVMPSSNNGNVVNVSSSDENEELAGENYLPTNDCADGGNLLVFAPQDYSSTTNNVVAYQLVTSNNSGRIMRYDNTNTGGVPITDPNVNIERLDFIVNGSDPNDKLQAAVYLMMKGSVLVKGNLVPFSIQTLASQRNF